MKRILFTAALTTLVGVSNIVAQSDPPPAVSSPAPAPAEVTPDAKPADPKAPVANTADSKASSQTPGVRKLTRRERKDRIKALSDEYRQYLSDVEPIMQQTELDTFLLLETDPQREIYITEFWRRRDRMQGTTNHSYRDEYYERLSEIKERFKYVSSERSRIFLIHGEPSAILEADCSHLLQPVQIWNYDFVEGLGHTVRFLFYKPRNGGDYKLWIPVGMRDESLEDLVSEEAMALGGGPGSAAVRDVFYASAGPSGTGFVSKIEVECKYGDEILRAIFQSQQNRTDMPKVFEPPQVNEEDVHKILRSVVLATPNAPKLTTEMKVAFPAKSGSRTDAEVTIFVPKSQLTIKEVGGVRNYSVDVTGEILKDDALFENYRYRFDFPAATAGEKLPVVVDRFLRPNTYKARIKVSDANASSEAILEQELVVPELFDTPEQQKMKESASSTVAQIKDDIESAQTRLRIVPLSDELLSGLQHIETIAYGEDIKAVEFYLDNKKVMVKRQPPYTLDLDVGLMPQVRKIRAVALNEKGEMITGDEIIVNTGNDPFRVHIVSPRVAIKAHGRTRVEMSVSVPDGKVLDRLELYLNETRVATLFGPPYVQTVDIPPTEGVGYLRAVALLKDNSQPQVEDVVMINTPQFMEELNVHLVELPTTVISGGKPLTSLPETAFKVMDDGKPVKVAKFEYVKNLPLSIGLAIDTSGSMQPRMAEAQKAASQFFSNVLKQGDKAFLVSFDSQPQMIQKWSPKLADVNAGLAKLRAEEATSLYDAVVFSLYNFLGVKGQKALVVLTDGKDTASKFTYDQALEYARRTAVPIYGIGLGIRPTEVDVRYKFGRFCSETGGNVYYIEQASDLQRIYEDIQNELRSQYVIGFYPPEGVKAGGKWREITVQTSEGKAKTIRGYYP